MSLRGVRVKVKKIKIQATKSVALSIAAISLNNIRLKRTILSATSVTIGSLRSFVKKCKLRYLKSQSGASRSSARPSQ